VAVIVGIVRPGEETVRRWLKRSLSEGTEGPRDVPVKVTAAYVDYLFGVAPQWPRRLDRRFSL